MRVEIARPGAAGSKRPTKLPNTQPKWARLIFSVGWQLVFGGYWFANVHEETEPTPEEKEAIERLVRSVWEEDVCT